MAALVDRSALISFSPGGSAAFLADFAAADWGPVVTDPVIVEADPELDGWAAHAQVLGDALRDGVQALAVFEDTVHLPPATGPRLARLLEGLPPDAVGLWLTARQLGEDNRLMRGPTGAALLKHAPLDSSAYVFGRPLIEKLADMVQRRRAPVGRLYANAQLYGLYAATPPLVIDRAAPEGERAAWVRDLQRSNASRWLRLDASRV